MKHIGLVSVTNHNFGSILQTYALQRAVRKTGCETEIILYKEGTASKLNRLRNLEYMTTRVKMVIKSIKMRILHPQQKNNLSNRSNAFTHFISKQLSFTELFTSKEKLSQIAHNYDGIILGSDQVWHPMNLLMDFFTLNFVPDEVNKVAYAPSFGVSSIPSKYKEAYKKYVSRINWLSCREMAGVKIIKDLIGKDVPLVCDPTLLLTGYEWSGALSNSVHYDEKYIFCYFIGNNPNQRRLARNYANKYGLKIVALLHIDEFIPTDEYYADYTPYNVGPEEFLYLINNAELIMTDSFHATVFSLTFKKNFFTFNRFEHGKGNSTSSRIDSLLSVVNLDDRKVPAKANMEILEHMKAIEYEDVERKLNNFRNISFEYLQKAIHNE